MEAPYIPSGQGKAGQEPTRHGDSLDAKPPVPTLRQILGDEAADRSANACRYIGLVLQGRRDPGGRSLMEQTARLFQ
jgi:hypothetical protein